jgi:hypothetical protein
MLISRARGRVPTLAVGVLAIALAVPTAGEALKLKKPKPSAFGSGVAISADATTALIGGPSWKHKGAVWVYIRSGLTWVEQAMIRGAGAGVKKAARFGENVALSSDGNTALISASGNKKNAGAAYVFTRSAGIWSEQREFLASSEHSFFGRSIALSSDGNTALVGGSGEGAVFGRSGSTWTRQESFKGFGAVALSANGNTALVGGVNAPSGNVNSVTVYTRTGTTWTEQGAPLTGAGESGEGGFGESVALSSDGNLALIGGPRDEPSPETATRSGVGAVWVFKRSGETWSAEGGKLTGKGEAGLANFGESVALSAEGNTALIGGFHDNGFVGAAWVFTRSGEVWSQQGEKLTGSGEVGAGSFGSSVGLSAEGSFALIGGNRDLIFTGATWAFGRSGETWTQEGQKLVGR